MGGNALKEYNTVRLPRDEYFSLTGKFMTEFDRVFPGAYATLILSYGNKPDFGDADFLILSEGLPPNWTDILKKEFNLDSTMYFKNGNIVSIGYENFQIDLIVTPEKHFEFSDFYFSYNDFGNLIGRMTHKLGLKIGFDGISMVVREHENHILKNIVLSTNFEDALTLLGLDIGRYLSGFNELEDMFEYVASSKWFDPEIYSLEHRSSTSRVRDVKRATYNKFLRWVADTKPKANHSFANKSELGGYGMREPYYTEVVLKNWPWVKQEADDAIAKYELDVAFKDVYNGNIVSAMTGLEGKELGMFMSRIASITTDDVKREWIKHPECVEAAVSNQWILFSNGK